MTMKPPAEQVHALKFFGVHLYHGQDHDASLLLDCERERLESQCGRKRVKQCLSWKLPAVVKMEGGFARACERLAQPGRWGALQRIFELDAEGLDRLALDHL